MMDMLDKMRTTTDTQTGLPFRWNATVVVGGVVVPARYTTRAATHLHPDRVPAKLLAELNPQPQRPDWCPDCENDLDWHHTYGEPNGCTWTD